MKTASGILRFQGKKKYGSCFKKLFKVVKSIDNCQSDQDIERGTSSSSNSSNSRNEGTLNESMITTSKKRPLFVPIHQTTKKGKKRHAGYIQSALEKINEALNADPTKGLISFSKEHRNSSDRISVFLSFMRRMLTPQSHMAPQSSFGWNFQ